MIQFYAGAPFPLMSKGEFTYAEAQQHADRVDDWLGLNTRRVETSLYERGCMSRAPNACGSHQQLWIGLATQNLLTPYVEIRRTLHELNLKTGQTVVDLGAAYGRMGFVIGRHYPGVQFIGYEFVGERLKEGLRVASQMRFPNVKLIHADLSSPDFTPAEADVYFIYDYGKPQAIEKTLHDLRRVSLRRDIVVIARGQTCQSAIVSRHFWLQKAHSIEENGRSSVFVLRK